MPRPIRYDYPGSRHHIMNRSRSHENLFIDDADYRLFVSLLAELEPKFGLAITAFVLMPSHFHLGAASPRGNISTAIGFLEAQFVRRSNFVNGLDGPRFRNRFTNRLVTSKEHWLYLVSYLHLNPVRARLVAHADEYAWSSHASSLSPDAAPPWLHVDEHLSAFGSAAGYCRFIDSVARGYRPMPNEFDSICPGSVADLPALPSVARGFDDADVNRALLQVCEAADVSPRRLLTSRWGVGGNPERAAALFWLVNDAGLSVAVAASRLGMRKAAARQLLCRLRRPGNTHQAAKMIIANLRELFNN